MSDIGKTRKDVDWADGRYVTKLDAVAVAHDAMWQTFKSLENLRIFHGNPHGHDGPEDTFKAAVNMYWPREEL